jgi:hypothetical protein
MAETKSTEDKFADTVGELVAAAQRGDFDTVRNVAQALIDAIDATDTEEAEEPKEPSFRDRFNAALDEKAAKEASS